MSWSVKPRDVGNVVLDRSSRLGLRLRLATQSALALTHRYQPDPFATGGDDARGCRARFDAMMATLGDVKRPSVLDLGCNQGFFTLSFARMGGLCIGIDNDRGELMAARARAELHRIRNVAFIEMFLDADSMSGLPRSDIVVCLSIFHHWVRAFGRETAEKLLAALADRAGHALVFDSGQPEETSTRWAKELTFMQPSGRAWIETKLGSLGFAEVVHAGTFPTSLSPVPRDLFVALRSPRPPKAP